MTDNELIDKLIRIKDSHKNYSERLTMSEVEAINEACNRIEHLRGKIILPAIGETVYSFLWTRPVMRPQYWKTRTMNSSLIVSEYMMNNAADFGEISIVEKPMRKTDIMYMGRFVFETKEAAEEYLAKRVARENKNG